MAARLTILTLKTALEAGDWGAVIFTLRTLGWPIESIDVPSPTPDNPTRIISVYYLPGKYVALAWAALNRGPHGA